MVRNPSRCAGAMFVITAMSGQAMPASLAISPGALEPISRIAASSSPDSSSSARGIPIRLFRFPGLRITRRDRERRQNSISLVVVFPELPVMPTRGMSRWRSRWARAMSPRASTGSRTTKTGFVPASAPGTFLAPASETIAASAPFPKASPTKSAPSARAPGSAMKTDPGPTSRLSAVTAPIGSDGEIPPASRIGWIAPITSGSVILLSGGKHVPDRLPVVERQAPISDDLDILMSFPDDRHGVPRLREGEGECDRRFPVGLHAEEPVPPGYRSFRLHEPLRRQPGDNLRDDRGGVLVTRVVGGHDHDVGPHGRHPAHRGALPAVAVPPAAEHGDEPSRRQSPQGREDPVHPVRGVGVVHEH